MFRNQSKRFWIILIACVAVFVFYFPSLVAFRYTAPPQNVSFLYKPWKSWAFAYTALTVPGDAKLKTSGEALREAQKVWPGPIPKAQEVRVVFVPADEPYTFTHDVAGTDVTTTVTPSFAFVWQVRGEIGRRDSDTVIGLLDYRTGDVLYDVRDDLGGSQPAGGGEATPSATGSSAPGAASPSPSATP
jgi:hypothetical protein